MRISRSCPYIAFLVFSAFLICLPVAAQKKPAASSSATSAPAKNTATPVKTSADYPQEAYVVEKFRTAYRFEADGTGTREIYARIKVQSEAGVNLWGQLVQGYNSANERVEYSYVRVLKSDGRTVTADSSAIQDLTPPFERVAPVYTDFRQKQVTVPGLTPGDTLEYDVVTTTFKPLAPGQFWMEYDFDKSDIVLDEELEVNVPKDRKPKVKTHPGNDPKISEENGRTVYRWTSSHLEREDDSAKAKAPKKKEPTGPAIQMTTFADWAQMGAWYAGLEKDRRQPNEEIRAKAAELTKGKTTDLEKIEALYDYVATNFRYISLSFGIGRFQPHAAADVLHNQYGDCKDKHTLLASLLEAAGYHASSVLINSGRKLDPDVPSPTQFDHVITMVPLGKKEIWMDSTTEVAPFRLLSVSIRNKQALVIPQDGAAHLEKTPADPPVPDKQVLDFDGKINPFGKLTAHISLDVRGDTGLLLRSVFRRVPNAKWNDLVKNISSREGLNGEVSNLKVSDPANTKEDFSLAWDVSVANYLNWGEKKSSLALPMADVSIPNADSDDTGPDADPIDLSAVGEITCRVKLEFPAKYALQTPLAFSLKRDYGQYDATYKAENNVFTAERHLVMSADSLPASRTDDYLAFRNAIEKDGDQHLSVDATAAGAPTASPDLKGDDLYDAAKAEMQRGNFSTAIELLKKVVAADPKNETAWLSLGYSYMQTRSTDNAIDAYKKGTELDPYNELAFDALGGAYMMERKYDDAAAAYQKAIEINPLSEYAHAGLGGMYVDAKQYDKAVPELEKAASIKPDDAGLSVQLGYAYLNNNQDEKAVAAYDKAAQLSPTPMIWNDIAYELSLKKAHLDRAQQYAESAVSTISAASRNISLGQLTQNNLGTVSSLSALWDTLGWVYFAEGDYSKAEKYCSVAWVLGFHAEVGDHMGQIYEKLGDKQQATQAYAMAMSGDRPMPETSGHLRALVKNDKEAKADVDKYRLKSQDIRTIPMGKISNVKGGADFFVLLTNDGGKAKVEDVKFISGNEKLKPVMDALRKANYNFTFPDDRPAKVLRRGTFSCDEADGECIFVMMDPQDVFTVD